MHHCGATKTLPTRSALPHFLFIFFLGFAAFCSPTVVLRAVRGQKTKALHTTTFHWQVHRIKPHNGEHCHSLKFTLLMMF